ADHQVIAVFAIGMRQIRTDRISFAEQSMTGRTVLDEKLASVTEIARARAQLVAEPPHLGQFLFRRSGLDRPPDLPDHRIQLLVFVEGNRPKLVGRYAGIGDGASLDFLQEPERPISPA